jgi:thiamine pyrophosphokinase
MNGESSKRTIIILNGQMPSGKLVRETVGSADTVIAADGAADQLRALGLKPDVIIGDEDSISPVVLEAFNDVETLHVPEQDTTDFDKAMRLAIERGATDVVVLGAGGGRVDHTLSNLGIARKYHDRARVTFLDNHCRTELVRDELAFEACVGKKVSILPIGCEAKVTTKGLRWELEEAVLELGVYESVSNEAVAAGVSVSVASGCVAVFIFH